MLLTVFTPTYNRADLLPRLRDSLLLQGGFDRFTWLVVDDGSSDGTAALVKGWAADSPFAITFVAGRGRGKHDAYNLAIEAAASELLTCVDSDDLLLPGAVDAIEELWEALRGDDAVGGFCGQTLFLDGKPLNAPYPEEGMSCDTMRIKDRFRIHDVPEIYRLSLLKRYRFPVFPGERFVTEARLFDELTLRHPFRYFNRPMMAKEYLPGGLTAKSCEIRRRNPLGTLDYYARRFRLTRNPAFKAKAALNWLRFAIRAPAAALRLAGGETGFAPGSLAARPRPYRVALAAPMANFAMGHYTLLLAEGLAAAGAEVLVVTSEAFAYRARLEAKGVRVIATPRRNRAILQMAALLDPRSYAAAFRALRDFRPDAVHLLNGEGYPLGLALALRHRARLVLTLHDPVPHAGSLVDALSRAFSLPTILLAGAIHVHREVQAKELRAVLPWKRIFVAPHGSFAPLFDPPAGIKAEDKEELALFWGRIEPYKGVDILARALALIDRRWRVVIAGAGKLDEETKALIAAAGDRVSLENRFIPDEELRALLIRAKYAVFPYRSATQSGAPLLAAAFGVRAVLSPVPSFLETADAIGGIVMERLSPEAIAKALSAAEWTPAALSGDLGFGSVAERLLNRAYPRRARPRMGGGTR